MRPAAAVIPIFVAMQCLAAAAPDWRDQGVIDNRRSPYARVHPVPVRAVRMREGFWAARMKTNEERSIPTFLDQLEAHGVVDNFRRLTGNKSVERRGPLYTDSDLYKWMEAAAFVLQSHDDPKLRARLDGLIAEVIAAQEPSGYLNTYYVEARAEKRFTEMNRSHELYCLGHLLQAAIAYYRATGDRKLLDAGSRFAAYLAENFGPQKHPALTGHPELEMALIELYRTNGERRYLDFAGYLLSGVERERLKLSDRDVQYMFSGKPFTSRTHFEGHAVRAMYASCGAADYYAETGDAAYARTLETLWRDMAGSKMYLTGGVGSRAAGEAFGEPYELPNMQAYTESCAAIGNMMWNWRMFLNTGEARFVNVIERALYNGINSGMSLDGTLYCYRNPLESRGERIRNPWYDTTCCPPNLERILASLPGYLYATSPRGIYVNFFHSSELAWKLEDGTPVRIEQSTEYPWKGDIELVLQPARATEFSVFVRIPDWAGKATVDGAGATPGKFYEARRVWRPGDRVRVHFDMAPRLTEANPLLRENTGRVAVERGPLVYCLETPDNSGADVLDAALPPGVGFAEERRANLLGGVIVLRVPGLAASRPSGGEPLYMPAGTASSLFTKAIDLTLIPYYAWANRGTAAMQVWVPITRLK